MKHLTADGGSSMETVAPASLPDLELDLELDRDHDLDREPDVDCALARAIRRLIAVTRSSAEPVNNLD